MTEIERGDLTEIEDRENLQKDCEYIRNIKNNIKQTFKDNIEEDYFEFLKCVDISEYSIESIKLLRMFVDFEKNRC